MKALEARLALFQRNQTKNSTDTTPRARKRSRVISLSGVWRGFTLFCVGLLMVFFIAVGRHGVNFGPHWDEGYEVEGVQASIEKLAFFPQFYGYGNFYYLPGIAVVVGNHVSEITDFFYEFRLHGSPDPLRVTTNYPTLARLQASARAFAWTLEYMLQTRTAFVCVTSFAVLWVYLAFLNLYPKRYGPALAVAACIGLSWEVGYHSRFIAVDLILAQFTCLFLFVITRTWRTTQRHWYFLGVFASGFSAGLVSSSKITGVWIVLSVVAVVLLRPKQHTNWGERLVLSVVGVAGWLLAMYLINPGIFLDPFRFLAQQRAVQIDYNSTGEGYPYFVAHLPEHLGRALVWLFLAVPSSSLYFAVPVALLAIIGGVVFIRNHPRLALGLAVFPCVYLCFMCSNHLMIVRNYLTTTPFFALAFGAGVVRVGDWLRQYRLRPILTVGLLAGFAFNAYWLVFCARSIVDATPTSVLADVAKDLKGSSKPTVISSNLFAALKTQIEPDLECKQYNSKETPPSKAKVFMYHHEDGLLANRPFRVNKNYGSFEMNYDWYPTWGGYRSAYRVIQLPPRVAEGFHIDFTNYQWCNRRS